MNIWLSENFFINKKIKRLQKDLNADAVICLQKLWLYAARYAIDNLLDEDMVGILKDFDEVDIELNAGWSGEPNLLYSTLNNLKLILKKNKQYFIHDFTDNNPHIYELIKKKINGSIYAKRRWENKKKQELMGDPIDTHTVTEYKGKVSKDNVIKDKKKDTVKQVDKIPYKEIVDYLNKVTGHRYELTTKTKGLIRVRHNGKRTIDNFKLVIDDKNKEWRNDPKTAKWLRPSTLFGTKFDDYLAQALTDTTEKKKPAFIMTDKEQEEFDNGCPF